MNPQQALQHIDTDVEIVKSRPETQFDVLIRHALDQKATVDVMDRMLDIKIKYEAMEAKKAFDAALAAFQGECPVIAKRKSVMNKNGVGVRYKYATIDQIVAEVKPLLAKHNFSYSIDAEVIDVRIKATVKITHSQGHSQTSSFMVPVDKDSYMNAQQQFASALTFAKRYAFCGGFGIMTGDEDDDARINTKAEDPGSVTELKRQLWDIVRPIRGDKQSWDQAQQWMIDECCMDPDSTVRTLDAAGLRQTISKVTAKLV